MVRFQAFFKQLCFELDRRKRTKRFKILFLGISPHNLQVNTVTTPSKIGQLPNRKQFRKSRAEKDITITPDQDGT